MGGVDADKKDGNNCPVGVECGVIGADGLAGL
jgi:hypothetical protein